jgi:hypothetical protein
VPAVGCRPDSDQIRHAEDRDAVAAGVQNVLLAATAAGLGTDIDQQHIARLSPAGHNHINFYGRYDFTNPDPPPTRTYRPLRVEHDRNISAI